MALVSITLKQNHLGLWILVAPKGHTVGGPFRGSSYEALGWTKAWISSFHNWTIVEDESLHKMQGS